MGIKPTKKSVAQWAKTQSEIAYSRLALDSMPEVASLLEDMLAAVNEGDKVNWRSVCRYIRQHYNDAPSTPRPYSKYAAKRLGWTE